MGNSGKSEKKWELWLRVGKSWEKVGKVGEKVGKVGKSGYMWCYVAKSG